MATKIVNNKEQISFWLRCDLAKRVRILSAKERVKQYEILEEALVQYFGKKKKLP